MTRFATLRHRYHQSVERSRRAAVVVFDLGEVLAEPGDLYERLAAAAGADRAAIERAYWVTRDAYDRGAPAREYWQRVAREAGIDADDAVLDELDRIDGSIWSGIRADAAALLRDVHDTGTAVAILSNAPASLAVAARGRAWAEHVDHWFFSAELGLAKPDAEIYAVVGGRLAVDPAAIVFIDDRRVNVDAARAAGWNAHLWRSDADTREVLVAAGIL